MLEIWSSKGSFWSWFHAQPSAPKDAYIQACFGGQPEKEGCFHGPSDSVATVTHCDISKLLHLVCQPWATHQLTSWWVQLASWLCAKGDAGINTELQINSSSYALKMIYAKTKLGKENAFCSFMFAFEWEKSINSAYIKTELPFLPHKPGNGHTFPSLGGEIHFIFCEEMFCLHVFICTMYAWTNEG